MQAMHGTRTSMSVSHIQEHFAKSKSNEHMETYYGRRKSAARNEASTSRLSMAVFAVGMIYVYLRFEASTVNGRIKRPVTSIDLCHAGILVAGRLVASRSGWSRSE
jgi:hypothetical protein